MLNWQHGDSKIDWVVCVVIWIGSLQRYRDIQHTEKLCRSGVSCRRTDGRWNVEKFKCSCRSLILVLDHGKTMLELNVVETDLGLMGTPISKVNTGTDMYRLMFRGIPMYGRRSVLLIFQIWSVNRFHSSMIGYGMKQLNYHYDPVGKELWYSKFIRFWLEAWVRIIRT